jgi:hypothetical protein
VEIEQHEKGSRCDSYDNGCQTNASKEHKGGVVQGKCHKGDGKDNGYEQRCNERNAQQKIVVFHLYIGNEHVVIHKDCKKRKRKKKGIRLEKKRKEKKWEAK